MFENFSIFLYNFIIFYDKTLLEILKNLKFKITKFAITKNKMRLTIIKPQ